MIAQSVAPYSAFAPIYDQVMTHVPVKRWVDYLISSAGERSSLVDLACGTGEVIREILRRKTIPVTGVDFSHAMLALARLKLKKRAEIKSGSLTSIPLQDGKADWAICTHDSVNYLVDPSIFCQHLVEVNRILCPGGMYSFDAVTEENMVEEFDGRIREEMFCEIFLHWSNHYDSDLKLLRSHLTFQDGVRTSVEYHEQRFYTLDEIVDMAAGAGFEVGPVDGDYYRRRYRRGDSFMNFNCRKHA